MKRCSNLTLKGLIFKTKGYKRVKLQQEGNVQVTKADLSSSELGAAKNIGNKLKVRQVKLTRKAD